MVMTDRQIREKLENLARLNCCTVTELVEPFYDPLVKEAIGCYICSLREDNERLSGLVNRQIMRGGSTFKVPNKIEANNRKIEKLRRLYEA